jgi:von Willebrand factor type A domain
MVGGIATALAAVATAFALWDRFTEEAQAAPSTNNIEFLLDSSEGMGAALPAGGTRLDAAIEVLHEELTPHSRTNTALRSFGSECDESSDLRVDFATENVERIRDSLDEDPPEPTGKANLAFAILEAANDFDDAERFPPSTTRRVVVITGSADECNRDPVAWVEERAPEGVDIDIDIVGFGLSPEEQAELNDLAEAFGNARTAFAADPAELRGAFHQFATVEPAIETAEGLIGGHNEVSELLTELGRVIAADEPDYGRAEDVLESAEEAYDRTDAALQALRALNRQAALADVYADLLRAHAAHRRGLDVSRRLLDERKDVDIEDSDSVARFQAVAAELQQAAAEHNAAIREAVTRLDEVRQGGG